MGFNYLILILLILEIKDLFGNYLKKNCKKYFLKTFFKIIL